MEAYKIYKNSVGGIAWNGDKMKDFDEMPDKQKNAWIEVETKFIKQVKRINPKKKQPEKVGSCSWSECNEKGNFRIGTNKECKKYDLDTTYFCKDHYEWILNNLKNEVLQSENDELNSDE